MGGQGRVGRRAANGLERNGRDETVGAVNPMTRGVAAQRSEVAMEAHEIQQEQQQGPLEEITTLEDAHARLGTAKGKPAADSILNAAGALGLNEADQLLLLKKAVRFSTGPNSEQVPAVPDASRDEDEEFAVIYDVILEDKLAQPGESMSEEALTEAVMVELTCPGCFEVRPERKEAAKQTRRLVAEALDALTDEGLLARVETLVVLRPDARPTEQPGRSSYEGITPDDIRALLNEELLAAGPGYSMDRGAAFSRTNHALNCLECAHDPAHLNEFAVVFDEAIEDLIEDGILAEIVSYVRLPNTEEYESVSA
jgi:hypothetical protein